MVWLVDVVCRLHRTIQILAKLVKLIDLQRSEPGFGRVLLFSSEILPQTRGSTGPPPPLAFEDLQRASHHGPEVFTGHSGQYILQSRVTMDIRMDQGALAGRGVFELPENRR